MVRRQAFPFGFRPFLFSGAKCWFYGGYSQQQLFFGLVYTCFRCISKGRLCLKTREPMRLWSFMLCFNENMHFGTTWKWHIIVDWGWELKGSYWDILKNNRYLENQWIWGIHDCEMPMFLRYCTAPWVFFGTFIYCPFRENGTTDYSNGYPVIHDSSAFYVKYSKQNIPFQPESKFPMGNFQTWLLKTAPQTQLEGIFGPVVKKRAVAENVRKVPSVARRVWLRCNRCCSCYFRRFSASWRASMNVFWRGGKTQGP